MNPNPSGRRPVHSINPSQLRPQRRVFDIAPPGRTPASSTSRPVLAGHKPPVQDMSVRAPGMSAPRPILNPHSKPQAVAPNGMEFAPRHPAPPSAPAHRVAPPIQPPSPVASVPQPKPPTPLRPPVATQPLANVRPQPLMQTPQLADMSSPLPSVAQPAARLPQLQPQHNDNLPDLPNLGPVQLTDDEPVLISKHVPQDGSNKWRWIIAASVIFLFLLVVFDILLDADFITLRQIPHTHFF